MVPSGYTVSIAFLVLFILPDVAACIYCFVVNVLDAMYYTIYDNHQLNPKNTIKQTILKFIN